MPLGTQTTERLLNYIDYVALIGMAQIMFMWTENGEEGRIFGLRLFQIISLYCNETQAVSRR
jgi:hypothetical protein